MRAKTKAWRKSDSSAALVETEPTFTSSHAGERRGPPTKKSTWQKPCGWIQLTERMITSHQCGLSEPHLLAVTPFSRVFFSWIRMTCLANSAEVMLQNSETDSWQALAACFSYPLSSRHWSILGGGGYLQRRVQPSDGCHPVQHGKPHRRPELELTNSASLSSIPHTYCAAYSRFVFVWKIKIGLIYFTPSRRLIQHRLWAILFRWCWTDG